MGGFVVVEFVEFYLELLLQCFILFLSYVLLQWPLNIPPHLSTEYLQEEEKFSHRFWWGAVTTASFFLFCCSWLPFCILHNVLDLVQDTTQKTQWRIFGEKLHWSFSEVVGDGDK